MDRPDQGSLNLHRTFIIDNKTILVFCRLPAYIYFQIKICNFVQFFIFICLFVLAEHISEMK